MKTIFHGAKTALSIMCSVGTMVAIYIVLGLKAAPAIFVAGVVFGSDRSRSG